MTRPDTEAGRRADEAGGRDFVAYRLVGGTAKVVLRGTWNECHARICSQPSPPLYIAYRPRPRAVPARLNPVHPIRSATYPPDTLSTAYAAMETEGQVNVLAGRSVAKGGLR